MQQLQNLIFSIHTLHPYAVLVNEGFSSLNHHCKSYENPEGLAGNLGYKALRKWLRRLLYQSLRGTTAGEVFHDFFVE